ncbi:Oidioi.mRNA.OKI2018_I69.XSR.g15949.t1.cds [Oikopleura dioica]|uniref:Oidioi.mRNA.OKI2018_I69.XSR.g15949.t1.cds n=1 Tax=Oikopleura dioica TaxID=34765 RepID=A0ABN7SKV7_OIKDI|nr:Oidioi.mRNA.OKI2018_I69.XSR.g15949.t1.cds [Oikopleura dioica]
MEKIREICVDLLNPEKAAAATARMKEIKNDKSLLPNLMQLTLSDHDASVRQMAAVLLRKDIARKFSTLQANEQNAIREHMLQSLTTEEVASVWSAVAEICSGILRKNNEWPDFFNLVQQACESQPAKGAELLARMATSAPAVVREKTTQAKCLELIGSCLNNNEATSLHQALRALGAILTELDESNQAAAKSLLQKSVGAVQCIAEAGEGDWAAEGFEVFQSALDCPVSLLNADALKDLSTWAAQVFGTGDADPALRCCAGNFLTQAVSAKSKFIKKKKMTQDLMHLCFPILMEDEEDEDDEEEDTPRSIALQLLDTISIKLPNTEVLGVIMEFATRASQGQAHQKRAALSALAVICEGCASPLIEAGHVESLVTFACESLQSDNPALRGAALYALGQFAEQMVGAMTEFAPRVLQLVTGLLENSPDDLMKHSQLEKGLYCIEQLAETLDEDQIESLLPSLMSSMHRFMQMGNSDKCQVATLAVSALGVIIACAENVIGPHLHNCISMLEGLLPKSAAATAEDTPENIMLQASALDTLATLASAAGESFVPMAADSLSLAGQLVSAETDPDIRRAALNLSCSVVSLPNSPPQLLEAVPRILECLMETLKSTEGIGVKMIGDDDNEVSAAFEAEDIDDDIEDGDDGEEIEHFTIENSYMEEKHTALSSIIRMAQKIPEQLANASTELYNECKSLTDFVNEDVRKFACAALIHLGHAMFKVSGNEAALVEAVTKGIDTIGTDADHGCALLIMAEISEVLDTYKKPIETKRILETVRMAMMGELICMMDDDDEEDSGVKLDEEASEIEREILDGAGELLVAVAAVDPQGVITEGLADILPAAAALMKKPDSGSKACAIGILGDMFDTLGSNCAEGFVKQLLPVFMRFTSSEDDNIRNNSVYGVGVLVATSGETGISMIPEALKSLPLNESKNMQVRDNVTGAIARMLYAGHAETRAAYSSQFLARLPLTEDHTEWRMTLEVIEKLLTEGNQEVLGRLQELAGHCLNSVNNLNPEITSDKKTILKIGQFMSQLSGADPNMFAELKKSSPEKVWNKIVKVNTKIN